MLIEALHIKFNKPEINSGLKASKELILLYIVLTSTLFLWKWGRAGVWANRRSRHLSTTYREVHCECRLVLHGLLAKSHCPARVIRCLLLHHNNAPAHTAAKTLDCLITSRVQLVTCPLNSPDLALCDFLFPKAKEQLQERCFQTPDDAVVPYQDVLQYSIPELVYKNAKVHRCWWRILWKALKTLNIYNTVWLPLVHGWRFGRGCIDGCCRNNNIVAGVFDTELPNTLTIFLLEGLVVNLWHEQPLKHVLKSFVKSVTNASILFQNYPQWYIWTEKCWLKRDLNMKMVCQMFVVLLHFNNCLCKTYFDIEKIRWDIQLHNCGFSNLVCYLSSSKSISFITIITVKFLFVCISWTTSFGSSYTDWSLRYDPLWKHK